MYRRISESIKYQDVSQNPHGLELTSGVNVTWFRQGEIGAPENKAGEALWSSDLPAAWLNSLIPICELRSHHGIDDPLCVLSVVLAVLDDNNFLVESALLDSGFGRMEEEMFTFDIKEVATNSEKLFMLMDLLLGKNRNDYFYSAFFAKAEHHMSTQASQHYRNFDYLVYKILEGIRTQNPIVLDIGTGRGELKDIAKGTATFIGSDVYQREGVMLSGKGEKSNLHYTWADAMHLPFADASLDLVTMFGVLGHHSTDSIGSILAEVSRTLKLDGIILINLQRDPDEPAPVTADSAAWAVASCRIFQKKSWGLIEIPVARFVEEATWL